ncbi:hypothetical protein BLNAU_20410 [Blattamonas nauphoetae]|uniref:Uncharacterized protein n=1 Tax=Blattamonas nauphoetae TaxID=2049346 RepID=A0ABQ9WZZ3_9EUKA|nr:hypothetical protein BLNAU_20410 [Blattamonas nauphoetae]
MSDNQDDTRDIVRTMELSQMIIFPSLNNWSDDDLLVPPTDAFMEEWKKQIHFDPSAYLERLKAIKSKTYLAAPPIQIEPPVSQTVRTGEDAGMEPRQTNENTSSNDSPYPFRGHHQETIPNSTPTPPGFDGVFEELQSPGPFEGQGAMDEFMTPQSSTGTEGQPEGMLTDETVRDIQSRILACNSPDFNSITNSPHHTMAPSRPLGPTSEPPPPYSDSKTRDMLELVAYQFNKENKTELPFEKAFKCPQPEKSAPEHQKREWRRSKALAMAALLTFVRDGYVESKQAAPYAPIFVKITIQKKFGEVVQQAIVGDRIGLRRKMAQEDGVVGVQQATVFCLKAGESFGEFLGRLLILQSLLHNLPLRLLSLLAVVEVVFTPILPTCPTLRQFQSHFLQSPCCHV